MKGRSLWTVLMLSWLSATNAPQPSSGTMPSDVSISGAGEEEDAAALPDATISDGIAATIGQSDME